MPLLHFNSRRYADLPLHYGKVPPWLAERMSLLGGAIAEAIVWEYGRPALLAKLSDPFWFQALGCVLGMDWHSSGITTSVMGALKRSLNQRHKETGIFIAGGKGRYSRNTPSELMQFSEKTGLDGNALVRSSRLTAKIDNTAIQDGFQVYLHTFVVSREGDWAVIQQGMDGQTGMARRYHWNSAALVSYSEEPHTSIYGKNRGAILNLTDRGAGEAKASMLELIAEDPSLVLPEVRKILMPSHHELRQSDVNMKRLGALVTLAHEREIGDFESLLLLEGMGPRAVQSLALVSEVIHGTPSRFTDPARFSFAHGGKDGHPFPVPLKIYDETISVLQHSIEKAKIGNSDRQQAIKNLAHVAQLLEESFEPDEGAFDKIIARERKDAYKHGGRTVFGKAKKENDDSQLRLF